MEALISKRLIKIDREDYEQYGKRLTVTVSHGNETVILFDWDEQGNQSNRRSFTRHLLGLDFKKGQFTAFIDGDPLNVERSNLKVVGREYFNRNRRTTKYKGVTKVRGEWAVVVYLTGKERIYFRTKDELEAARLYDAVCDYLKIEGLRNFPEEQHQLTENQLIKVRKISLKVKKHEEQDVR